MSTLRSSPVEHHLLGPVLRVGAAAAIALPISLASAQSAHPAPVLAAGHASSKIAQASHHNNAADLYARVPLHFEPNVGQIDHQVQFLARGLGYGLFLSARGATLAMTHTTGHGANAGLSTVALQIALLGANPLSRAEGLAPQRARSNYLIGNKRSAWHTNVPNYAQVRFQSIYHGIDLVYRGAQRQLEYDFVLHPGANPNLIRLMFTGTQRVSLDGHGNLVLRIPGGNVVQHAPVVYQQGAHGRVSVAGRFVLHTGGQVGFALGRYDHRAPLVIDPSLIYVSYLGGNLSDNATSVATDANGNLYVAGFTGAFAGNILNNFPTTPGSLLVAPPGGGDAFIAKFNPASTTGPGSLIYSTYLGGRGVDAVGTDVHVFHTFANFNGNGIAVDANGDVYVTGGTSSTDFPTSPSAFQLTYGGTGGNGVGDAFVSELNPTGSGLLYSTFLGGASGDLGTAIAVSGGRIYVTGATASVTPGSHDALANGNKNFPVTNGSVLDTQGKADAFVSVLQSSLSPASSQLVYSTYLGGTGQDMAQGIAVDASGAISIAGVTTSRSGLATPGAFQTTYGGGLTDAFVAKLNSAAGATLASQLVYATYLGGANDDYGNGIAVDATGHAYVVGTTYPSGNGTPFPTTPGAFDTVFGPYPFDAFVTELNANGSGLLYSTFVDASGFPNQSLSGDAIALDPTGNIFITGSAGIGLDTTPGALPAPAAANGAYVVELIPNLAIQPPVAQLAYSSYLDGNGGDSGQAIAVDANGFVYLSGVAFGTIPVTANAYQPSLARLSDAFVAAFLPQPTPAPLCTALATIVTSSWRLGVAGAVRPASFPPFATQYVTFRSGAASFVVRTSTLTCIRPGLGTGVYTFSGPIDSTRGGPFHHGDVVTITFTSNPLLLPGGSPLKVEISDPSAAPAYDSVATAPFLFGTNMVFSPN